MIFSRIQKQANSEKDVAATNRQIFDRRYIENEKREMKLKVETSGNKDEFVNL